jgi:nucleotide-binding universal stress UspA family protein
MSYRWLTTKAMRHESQRAQSSQVDETILAQARQLNAGLVVMGAYGQPTIREFFLGSVTRSLLQSSPLPLFLYH